MHRGKVVILSIVAAALLLAGYAWWHRYQQGRQAMQLWGPENALLIRHAPRVELLSLAEGEQPPGDRETLEVDGRKIFILKREDLSRARGLVHARHVLIEDASFDWNLSADRCGNQWRYALRFFDGQRTAHLALDLECGRAYLIENRADVRLVPRIKEALAKYIREHSEETLPDSETTSKYHELVQQLVSPNKEPTTRNRSGGSVRFPPGYDVKAQQRIDAIRQELHASFEKAIPALVDALDDERYCMTIDWGEGDGYYNYSVGQICRDVIASRLEVYRDVIRFSDWQHWHRYDFEDVSREWWQLRKGRSTSQLQIELVDWAISQRKAEAESEVAEERKNEILELQELRDGIAKSGKAAPSNRLLRMVTTDR